MYDYQEGSQKYSPYNSKPQMEHAGLLARFVAYFIDGLIVSAIPLAIYFYLLFSGRLGIDLTNPGSAQVSPYGSFINPSYLLVTVLIIIITLIYFTAFEGSKRQATLGKKLLGIRVVDEMGQKISMKTSFIRNLLRLIWSIPCIGTILLIIDGALVYSSDQRIGDKVANTYVIKGFKNPHEGIPVPPSNTIKSGPYSQVGRPPSYNSPKSSPPDKDRKTKYCTNCGREIGEEYRHCPYCGYDFTKF